MTIPFLRLRNDVSHSATGGRLTLRNGANAVTVDGPGAAFVATTILPRLDGTRTANALCAELAEVDAEDIMGLLEALETNGLLTGARPAKTAYRRQVAVAGGNAFQNAIGCALRDAGLLPTALDPASVAPAAILDTRDEAGIARFAAATRAQGSMALLVDGGTILSAPPARPGAAGCWHCAWLRYRANRRWRADPDGAACDPVLVARLMQDMLAGIGAEEALCVTDSATRAAGTHRFLPVPGCAACGGPSSDAPEPAAEPDADAAAFALIDRFVDPVTGIVNRLTIEPAANTGLDALIVATALPADAPLVGVAREMPVGWGKGCTLPHAVLGAIGEAVERYAASLPDPRGLVTARPSALWGDRLDPRAFALYRTDQYARSGFPYAPFDADAEHPWVRGHWIGGGEVWVPAVLTHLALDLRPEQAFCQGTSNGLAAGASAEEASLRALLELVERDAFLAAWMCGRPGRRLRLDAGLAPELLAVVEGLRAIGARVEATLLDSACGLPVVACFGFGDGADWPAVTLGLGCDPDPRAALAQAILELGQTGPYLRALLRDRGALARESQVTGMLDHARYYFPAGREARFARLVGGEGIALDAMPPRQERSLGALARAFGRARIRAALIDVTTGDVASAGVRVIRAVSPDLQPIAFGYGQERRPVARLAALGITAAAGEVTPLW